MKNLLVFIALSFWCTTVFSKTFVLRDTVHYAVKHYGLKDVAIHVVYTYPPEPYQPVYIWRIHVPADGSYPGVYTQDGELLGYTDNKGVLSTVVEIPDDDPSLCGWFINERVAVGSVTSQKSNSLNFTISDGEPHAGPLDPRFDFCRRFAGSVGTPPALPRDSRRLR